MELASRQDPHLREVVRFAVCCRALTLLLQALFNLLIPDHAADAFCPPRLSEPGLWDLLLEQLLGGLSHWDAEHFLFIAERGYLYEHNCAFFPLYPLSVRAVAEGALWPLQRLLRFAGPAYSESMFAFLAFSAMWQLEKGQSWLSGLLFSLASGVRANGLINAGFFLYSRSKCFALQLQVGLGSVRKLPLLWKQVLSLASSAVLMCAGIFLPFALFQYYAYVKFCGPGTGLEQAVPKPLLQLALDKGYRLAAMNGVKPPWCSQQFPVIYSYIQDAYWNVGFLRYFELRQIPNFLLALPVTLLGSWAAWTYIIANPWHCITLGLERRKSEDEGKPRAGFCCPAVFVYVVHATVLLAFGFFCVHVQVLTRFLGSSSPILYWFSAHLLQEYEPLLWSEGTDNRTVAPRTEKSILSKSPGSCGKRTPGNPVVRLLLNCRLITPLSKCILGFFLSYWLLGLILHCNFLPWT
nr:PREDICTED: GPI mannosyltransferase 2 [Phalacrocorax carbo]